MYDEIFKEVKTGAASSIIPALARNAMTGHPLLIFCRQFKGRATRPSDPYISCYATARGAAKEGALLLSFSKEGQQKYLGR